MNINRVEYGFGVGIEANGEVISNVRRETGLAKIRKVACELFGGCTLVATAGDWRDPDTGHVFSEPGYTLIVSSTESQFRSGERQTTLVETIKAELNQKAVACCAFPCQFTMI